MARKRTPPPDEGLPSGCFWAVLTTIAMLALAVFLGSWLFGLLLILPAPFVAYWLYGRGIIVLARLWRTGRGVLVYSNSPHWQEHIEQTWLPHLAGPLTVLNWSQRKQWRRSPAVRVFEHFCGTDQNFNPSVVLFRGLRRPLVFRFFHAFRDAKHGNREALEELERQLFEALDVRSHPRQPDPE